METAKIDILCKISYNKSTYVYKEIFYMNATIVLQRHQNWVKSNFELTPRVISKMQHVRNVFELSTDIAKIENMDQEGIFIAQVIAALHDIGRFPQIQRYNTFIDDERYNHSIEGAKMLQEGFLQQLLPETREYDEIVITAVKYHGLKDLPTEEVSKRTMTHVKLIRDADRIDLFERSTNQFETMFSTIGLGKSKRITPEIKRLFADRQSISVKDLRSKIDLLTLRLGLIGQYEFLSALKLIEKKDYINRLTQLFLERTDYDPEEIMWLREKAKEQLNLRKKELN